MEDWERCVVCEHDYTPQDSRPASLPCGHSFCLECVTQCSQCPMCRQPYDPNATTVNYLAENLLLVIRANHVTVEARKLVEGVLEDYDIKNEIENGKEDQDNPDDTTDMCDACGELFAELFCKECVAVFCRQCDQQIHSHKFLSNHSRISAKVKPTTDSGCDNHNGEKLSLFCQSCQHPICSYCCLPVMEGKHADHHVILLSQALEALSSHCAVEITKTAKALRNYIQQVSEQNHEISLSVSKTLGSLDKYVQTVSEVRQSLLRQREQAIQILHRFSLAQIDPSKDPVEFLLTVDVIRKKVEEAKNIMSYSPPICEEFRPRLEPLKKSFQNYSLHEADVWNSGVFSDSIILDAGMEQQIRQWLDEEKDCKWQLAFRASRDGFDSKAFHRNCDFRGPNIVILKANDFVFGGFAAVSWSSMKQYITCGGRSWLFSLTNPQGVPSRFPFSTGTHEMGCYDTYGPIFGKPNQLVVPFGTQSYVREGSYSTSDCASYSGRTFFCGEEIFVLQECEVYVMK